VSKMEGEKKRNVSWLCFRVASLVCALPNPGGGGTDNSYTRSTGESSNTTHQNEKDDMQAAKNLDELWEQQAQVHSKLVSDSTYLKQGIALTNNAGKLINIVKTKLVACALVGCEPKIPQLGAFKGKAVRSGRR